MKRIFCFVIPCLLLLSSCNPFKTTPEIGLALSAHFKDKRYQDFDTVAYNDIFNRQFDALQPKLSNPKVISRYFSDDAHKTAFITRFYFNGGLDTLRAYLMASDRHGFDPAIFGGRELGRLLDQLGQHKFKTIAEVYPVLADLQLYAASSLLKYDTFIGYGSVNPRKVLNRYYVNTARPDDSSMLKVLDTENLPALLKSIQPSDENYLSLQQAYLKMKQHPAGHAAELKALQVNMERLRWKFPQLGKEYVEVNIPDFTLTWFDRRDTVTHMKVCVGSGREKAWQQKMDTYLKTRSLDDKPKNHQTPILLSKFNSIQVNPVWNIPVSIAQNEIYRQAMRDPYYLSNNNMRVYYRGQLVKDPDTIQWKKYSRASLPFQFKQGSGAGNALGKFKFVFDNGSSIYLHDTNNKSAFNQASRAISHGCVRVEKPLLFAEKLVNDKYQYDQLRMEVNLPPSDTSRMAAYRKKMALKSDTSKAYELKPKWFGTKKNVYVFINYRTAWAANGKIEYRNDIYGLDDGLYAAMKKYR